MRTATTLGATVSRTTFAARSAATHFPCASHFLTSFRPLGVIELAVFVCVKLLANTLAHFGAVIIAFLAFLFWRLGDGRQSQRTGCD